MTKPNPNPLLKEATFDQLFEEMTIRSVLFFGAAYYQDGSRGYVASSARRGAWSLTKQLVIDTIAGYDQMHLEMELEDDEEDEDAAG